MYAHPVVPSVEAHQPRPKRWRHQFSLRLLLLLVTLASGCMAWVAHRRQVVTRERAAVAQLKGYGGVVQYAVATDVENEFLLIEGEPPGAEWLRDFLGDSFFSRTVEIEFSPIPTLSFRANGRGGKRRIEQWLEYPDLFGDKDVALLVHVSRIDVLELRKTKIGPEGIRRIREQFPDCTIESEPRQVPLEPFRNDRAE